jgi:hypothetical protein
LIVFEVNVKLTSTAFADTRDFRNTAEALSSFLRIPTAGFRGHIHGALGNVGADAILPHWYISP